MPIQIQNQECMKEQYLGKIIKEFNNVLKMIKMTINLCGVIKLIEK